MANLQHTQQQDLESEPERGSDDPYDWRIVDDVERGVQVRVNPNRAAIFWHTDAYHQIPGNRAVTDREFDRVPHIFECLHKSATFGCYYTVDYVQDDWRGLSHQQAAWWLALERVRTDEWPEELHQYYAWAAGNLAAEGVSLDEWPKGLERYAPAYVYDLTRECRTLKEQVEHLTALCARLAADDRTPEYTAALQALANQLSEAKAMISEAHTLAQDHYL